MGYLKLKDAGAHSVGLNNSLRIVSARPEFVLLNPLEFTVSGGTASAPQLQHAQSGLISVGTELWLKFAGLLDLTRVVVDGASESGGATAVSLTGGTFSGTGVTQGAATNLNNGNVSSDYAYGSSMVLHYDHGSAVAINQFELGDMYYLFTPVQSLSIYGSNSAIPSSGGTLLVSTTTLKDTYGAGADSNVGGANGGWSKPTYTNSTAFRYYRFEVGGNDKGITEIRAAYVSPITYTLSSLSPAQAALPEKVYKLRSDTSKPLMALAKGATDQAFSTSDFTTAVDIASVTYATGPELTVTGAETEITGSTTKRLALKLRSDITAVQMRARAAKIHIKEMEA